MRVQIKYTVDFDDIPAEVKKRFVDLMRQLQEVQESYRLIAVDDKSMHDFVEKTKQIRKKLYNIDIGFDDLNAISKGYLLQKLELEDVGDEVEPDNS